MIGIATVLQGVEAFLAGVRVDVGWKLAMWPNIESSFFTRASAIVKTSRPRHSPYNSKERTT